jgi:hypothetical protein
VTPDPSCLGVAGEQTQVIWVSQLYLAQETWVRRLHPTLMGSGYSKTQGSWTSYLRGVQSSLAWCCSQTHLNLGKFNIIININNNIIFIINIFIITIINIINIENIIICIINIFNFIIINIKNNIICIVNIVICIIINNNKKKYYD